MDIERRIEALERQIAEANDGRPSDFKAWRELTSATVRAVMSADHPGREALEKVRYGPMMASSATPQSDWDRARASGVRSAVAILKGCIRELELSVVVAPQAQASSLHPWIAGAVTGLWDNGHHRQAVDEATGFNPFNTLTLSPV
ncbi:MAG: hypothetical protein ABR593_08920 [Candidatus Limnocylindria bacterium]